MTTFNQISDYPQRRSTRLLEYDYARPGAYFVTICAHEQRCILGQVTDAELIATVFGKIARDCWKSLPTYHPISLDSFVIMPNHMHGIIVLDGTDNGYCGLPQVIRTFKSISARRINKLRNRSGDPVWQRGYHEHVIRNDLSLDQIRRYITNNPARWQYDREYPAYELNTEGRAGRGPAPTKNPMHAAVEVGPRPTRPTERPRDGVEPDV